MIELTSHRKVVARIVGVRQSENAGVARLLTAGVATWRGGKPEGAALACKIVANLFPKWPWMTVHDLVLRHLRLAETLYHRA